MSRPRHRQGWADAVTEYWSQIRLLDFLCGAAIVFAAFISPLPVPSGVLVSLFITAWATCVRPQWRIPWGGALMVLALCLFGYLIFVSMVNGMPWTQRITKFVLLLGIAGAFAQRRIDVRSFIVGTMSMSVLNVLLFYAGATPNRYPPYLTGFYDDKNIAGMYYALFGLLGLLVTRGRYWSAGWLVFSGAAVFLTGSRTSISAFVLALAWLGLRNRVAPLIRWILTAAGVWVLIFVETTFARVGMFADRTGTDLFREQIEIAMEAKIAATPWYGGGLNQGFVMLGGVRRMWFHDSYLQAFAEGGWIFLGATLIAFVVAGLGLFSARLQVPQELLIAEAGIVTVLVCAWKLGEVFMTVGAFIALGIAVGARFGRLRTEADNWWVER
ncbi:hypothetical protein IEE94_05370 [Yimella sp. cx-573]|nr:hypothetical protein [Yimella sp. cx-573]